MTDQEHHHKNKALHISVEKQYIDIIQILTGKNKTVLHIAIEKGNKKKLFNFY